MKDLVSGDLNNGKVFKDDNEMEDDEIKEK